MDGMNLLPVDIDGNRGGSLGAFGGALIGSWFGNGFMGRNGVGAGTDLQTNLVMDSLNTIQSGQNATNMNVLQSANQLGSGICEIGFQGAQNTASILSATTQGFAGLNTAIAASGYENRLATQDLGAKLASCCCETQKTIMAEGQATRALIDKYAFDNLQSQLCDAKAKIGAMEANAFTVASNQAQTNTILQHLAMLDSKKS